MEDVIFPFSCITYHMTWEKDQRCLAGLVAINAYIYIYIYIYMTYIFCGIVYHEHCLS